MLLNLAQQHKLETLVESHAERKAVHMLRGINHKHNARLNGIDESIQTVGADGEAITFHGGRDIANKKYLDKYISSFPPCDRTWITGNVALEVTNYTNWLLSGKLTKRYTYLKDPQEVKWVKKHALLAFLRLYLDEKQETHGFQDPVAERDWINIQMRKAFLAEACESFNHSAKHQEDPIANIEEVFDKYLSILDAHSSIAYYDLPELPTNTPDPLALPEEGEGE
jgi:hypothetical protein